MRSLLIEIREFIVAIWNTGNRLARWGVAIITLWPVVLIVIALVGGTLFTSFLALLPIVALILFLLTRKNLLAYAIIAPFVRWIFTIIAVELVISLTFSLVPVKNNPALVPPLILSAVALFFFSIGVESNLAKTIMVLLALLIVVLVVLFFVGGMAKAHNARADQSIIDKDMVSLAVMGKFVFELKDIKVVSSMFGKKTVLRFTVTNDCDEIISLAMYADTARAYDDLGNEYRVRRLDLGNDKVPADVWRKVAEYNAVPDVPIRMDVYLDKIPSKARELIGFYISGISGYCAGVEGEYGGSEIKFQNIPLSKGKLSAKAAAIKKARKEVVTAEADLEKAIASKNAEIAAADARVKEVVTKMEEAERAKEETAAAAWTWLQEAKVAIEEKRAVLVEAEEKLEKAEAVAKAATDERMKAEQAKAKAEEVRIVAERKEDEANKDPKIIDVRLAEEAARRAESDVSTKKEEARVAAERAAEAKKYATSKKETLVETIARVESNIVRKIANRRGKREAMEMVAVARARGEMKGLLSEYEELLIKDAEKEAREAAENAEEKAKEATKKAAEEERAKMVATEVRAKVEQVRAKGKEAIERVTELEWAAFKARMKKREVEETLRTVMIKEVSATKTTEALRVKTEEARKAVEEAEAKAEAKAAEAKKVIAVKKEAVTRAKEAIARAEETRKAEIAAAEATLTQAKIALGEAYAAEADLEKDQLTKFKEGVLAPAGKWLVYSLLLPVDNQRDLNWWSWSDNLNLAGLLIAFSLMLLTATFMIPEVVTGKSFLILVTGLLMALALTYRILLFQYLYDTSTPFYDFVSEVLFPGVDKLYEIPELNKNWTQYVIWMSPLAIAFLITWRIALWIGRKINSATVYLLTHLVLLVPLLAIVWRFLIFPEYS